MSGRDWQWPLAADETLLWQGRPAPRCYTFRNWKLALAGSLLFFASSFWMMLAYQLVEVDGYPWWLMLIPAPLVLLSLWFGPVSLLLARIRWENVFYALTDQRLIARDGLVAARFDDHWLTEISGFQQQRYSSQLVSLRLQLQDQRQVYLYCLEHPHNLLEHLQRLAGKPAE